ncbi:MAG TPA: GTP 3',8-cyclase MoaA [Rhodothermales bacterium]
MAPAAPPLTDSFGRRHTYLRISLTERCNLRCQYCMPAEGIALSPRDHILTFEEIERLARLFVGLGVDKIRLTGGEPLVRKDVEELAERIGAIGGLRTLSLTTNGLLLVQKLPALIRAGLKQVNISLDTLRADRFREITRRPGFEKVLDAIHAALAAPIPEVKVNCVVMRNVNEDEVIDFVALTKDLPIEVRFIEYMPFTGNGWETDAFVPYREMEDRVRDVYPDLTAGELDPHGTARHYFVPGHRGRVGFIASMSDAFCSGCNRIRLTADGSLKVCLFGNSEVSLRDAMRAGASDDELVDLIDAAIDRKKAAHAGMLNLPQLENRPMILIGG